MARSSGKDDGFIGKIGGTVTYVLNGKLVRRTIGKSTKPPTVKQLACRQASTIVTSFLHPVRTLVRIGFHFEGIKASKNAYNMANSYIRLNAIKGNYPDQMIDFEKVLFTKGNLPALNGATTELIREGIRFNWDPNVMHPSQKLNDRSVLIVYSADTGDAFYQLNGARRQFGTDVVQLPQFNKTINLQTYLAFISADQLEISNSVYLGQMTLLPSNGQ